MAEAVGPTASAVLATLAALSPAAEQRAKGRTIPLEWFRWLPANAVRIFATGPELLYNSASRVAPGSRHAGANLGVAVAIPVDHYYGERLAAIDQIRGQRSLRVGWLFVSGRTTDDSGRSLRVFHPLVTIPVRVRRLIFGVVLVPAGDAELTPLIEDGSGRDLLEAGMEFGGGSLDSWPEVALSGALLVQLNRLRRFAVSAAGAAGLDVHGVIPAGPGPEELLRAEGLQIVAGVGAFAVTETGGFSRAASLHAWAATGIDDEPTAFHSLYLPQTPHRETPSDRGPPMTTVESPYLLTPIQKAAVVRSRHDPITVVSGAPGTGKSHTIVAIACDALARGESVLVAAKSDDAVDALLHLLEKAPGPDPVVFGSHERRDALAKRLAGGQLAPVSEDAVDLIHQELDDSVRRRDAIDELIRDQLGAERLISTSTTPTGGTTGADRARLAAPALFDPEVSLKEAAELLAGASCQGGGWFPRHRRRKARRRLDQVAGSAPDVALTELADALHEAHSARLCGDLIQQGGLDLAGPWEELLASDDNARLSAARWLAAECRSAGRINESTLPVVTALATALRSGRAARRAQLGRVNRRLMHALPLWIGSLPDIDDLLPALPRLFDLVILDEASSIDQPLAASALLRASRAVIAGDPRQLRHVSFLSDEHIQGAVFETGLANYPEVASRLDVRRNSTFDVSTGVAPVTMLDEHFRSDPHLIDWVARRIYDGELKVATRTPATECKDCIDLEVVGGDRDQSGIVATEIEAVLTQLTALRRAGAPSVGVITPFRAQADALETAVLAAFSADDLQAMDLRVGTVHAFQGNERDVVIASFGVGQAGANSWSFVADPHLFDVLATRARKSFRLITAALPPAECLVEDYLRHADSPPGRPPPGQPYDGWTGAVAGHLRDGGLDVALSYPAGRHYVDVCVATPAAPVSIECSVHPDGPDAHIERHLALRRGGWRILDAYQSKWGGREGELAVELLRHLKPTASTPTHQ